MTTTTTEPVHTIFFQGHGASRHQAAKYAGPDGIFIQSRGGVTIDRVRLPNSLPLLRNLYTYDELDEIDYAPTWDPLYWLMQLVHYLVLTRWYGVEGVTHAPYNYWTRDAIGGREDVEQLVAAVQACTRVHPGETIVLFGCSRGAATVLSALPRLNALGLCDAEHGPVRLALVEAPFVNVTTAIIERWPRVSKFRLVPLLEWTLEKLTRYRRDQLSPMQAVRDGRFPRALPIGFIASKADTVVPLGQTSWLATEICKRRGANDKKSIEFLTLERASHNDMPLSAERETYKQFCDKMYAKVTRLRRREEL